MSRREEYLIELLLCLIPFGVFFVAGNRAKLAPAAARWFWRLYLKPARGQCPYALADLPAPCCNGACKTACQPKPQAGHVVVIDTTRHPHPA